MRKPNLILTECAVLTVLFCFAAGAAKAADPPQSLCVTTATKATYAAKTALMEKDIAPYAKNDKAAVAIKTYRTEMTTAWDAMNEPYCGFGKYGTASAIKSYGKSVDRARIAFVAAVKGLVKGGSTSVIATAPAEKVAVAEVKKEDPVSTVKPKVKFNLGLHKGLRSAAVLELQKTLADYFKQPADSDWLTGYFGPITQSWVLKFQLDRKVVSSATSPGAGLVGPKTTAALNSL